MYRYWNQQNYNSFTYDATGLIPTNPASTLTSAPFNTAGPLGAGYTGVDKLNSYVTKGNIFRATKDFTNGTLRTGLWYDVAKSYRHQLPSVPGSWLDAATPLFSETYTTTTIQPYLEYEFKATDALKVTPGLKYASYNQNFNHLADNGKAVGPLGCTYNKTNGTITGTGCASSISNSITYTDVLPSLDAHYQLQPNWAVYGQYAEGDAIPPTNVFDVKNAAVDTPPKATKSQTFQIGSVWKSDQYTLDVDVYHIKLDSPYSQTTDASGNAVFTLNGSQINQGIEVESNIMLNGGFSLYLNGTVGTAKFDTGLWVAGAPSNTETLGLNYQQAEWNTGLFAKRVGTLYNDNGSTHQAFTIDPVVLTNLFVNYSIKNPTNFAKQAKVQFGVNNLFNKHSIVGVATVGTTSSADLLTITPARSTSLTLKLDF